MEGLLSKKNGSRTPESPQKRTTTTGINASEAADQEKTAAKAKIIETSFTQRNQEQRRKRTKKNHQGKQPTLKEDSRTATKGRTLPTTTCRTQGQKCRTRKKAT